MISAEDNPESRIMFRTLLRMATRLSGIACLALPLMAATPAEAVVNKGKHAPHAGKTSHAKPKARPHRVAGKVVKKRTASPMAKKTRHKAAPKAAPHARTAAKPASAKAPHAHAKSKPARHTAAKRAVPPHKKIAAQPAKRPAAKLAVRSKAPLQKPQTSTAPIPRLAPVAQYRTAPAAPMAKPMKTAASTTLTSSREDSGPDEKAATTVCRKNGKLYLLASCES
jgi:hypothetical protein